MALIYDWCEERLEIQSIADDILGVNLHICIGKQAITTHPAVIFMRLPGI